MAEKEYDMSEYDNEGAYDGLDCDDDEGYGETCFWCRTDDFPLCGCGSGACIDCCSSCPTTRIDAIHALFKEWIST